MSDILIETNRILEAFSNLNSKDDSNKISSNKVESNINGTQKYKTLANSNREAFKFLKRTNNKENIRKNSNNKENIDVNLRKNKASSSLKDKQDSNRDYIIADNSKENVSSKDSKQNDIEKIINDLRRAYNEMRKERIQTEKETEHLEHKLKMLQSEELRAYKKFQNEKKFKEEWDNARQKTNDFRRFLNEAKCKKKLEIESMSKRIKEMREYIQRSSNVRKMMKFQENRLFNLQMKQNKIENGELRRSMIKEDSQRNKRMAESVKINEKRSHITKKVIDEEKRMRIKKELEDKLNEERIKKRLFELKLYSLEEIEDDLINKLRNSEEPSLDYIESKFRSVSTGGDSRKKAKDKLKNSVK